MDQHHVRGGDRLVVFPGRAARPGEMPQPGPEARQRLRKWFAGQIPPGDAHVLDMMEATRRHLGSFEAADERLVCHLATSSIRKQETSVQSKRATALPWPFSESVSRSRGRL